MRNSGSVVVHFFALSEAYPKLLYSCRFAPSEDAPSEVEEIFFVILYFEGELVYVSESHLVLEAVSFFDFFLYPSLYKSRPIY